MSQLLVVKGDAVSTVVQPTALCNEVHSVQDVSGYSYYKCVYPTPAPHPIQSERPSFSPTTAAFDQDQQTVVKFDVDQTLSGVSLEDWKKDPFAESVFKTTVSISSGINDVSAVQIISYADSVSTSFLRVALGWKLTASSIDIKYRLEFTVGK